MTRYSSKEQEKFFQPWRVQVLVEIVDTSWRGAETCLYRVAVIDVVASPRGVVDQLQCEWHPPAGDHSGRTEYFWSSQRNDGRLARFSSKQEALDAAKLAASERELPFDLQRDVVSYVGLYSGPEQACAACGKKMGRALRPSLCTGCKKALAAGRKIMADAKRRPYGIDTHRLIAGHRLPGTISTWDLSQEFARLLLGLISVDLDACGRADEDKFLHVVRLGEGAQGGSVKTFRASISQVRAMGELVDKTNELIDLAYAEGHRMGRALLYAIAKGEVSMSDLQGGLE